MKQFLNQFPLSAMQRIDLEMFIFGQASRMIDGHVGGQWESQKFGKVWITVIPGNEPAVRLVNYACGGELTSDRLTASVAFCSLVTNWYMGLRYEQGRFSDANIESFADYADRLKDHAKTLPDNGVPFFRFID
jgi:hypothetical protein